MNTIQVGAFIGLNILLLSITFLFKGTNIMTNQKQAEEVFTRLEKQLKSHPKITGLELAALQKDGVYTDDLCVRVLVNSKDATHESLSIPRVIDGVLIEVRFTKIELH